MQRPHNFQNVNVPNPVKKGKGKIEKIDFKEHEEEIKRIWEGKPSAALIKRWTESGRKGNHPEKYYQSPSMSSRFNSIKKLVGYNSNLVGYCSTCKNLNRYLVKYKTEGITIIERYCQEHVPDKIS